MFVKKLRRKCGVRGCKSIDTYSISLSREAGNTVIMCKSCLGKALGAIDEAVEEKPMAVSPTEAPPLFFNGRTRPAETPAEKDSSSDAYIASEIRRLAEIARQELETDAPAGGTPAKETPEEEEAPQYICPHCGQVCKSELGLQSHIKAKHKDVE